MAELLEPLQMRSFPLRNRIVRSATWEGTADPDGSVMHESYGIYAELARGGVGGIITGFTFVSADDRFFGGMMRLSSDNLNRSTRNSLK